MDADMLSGLLRDVRKQVYLAGIFMKNQPLTEITSKQGHANYVTDMDLKIQNRLTDELKELLPEAEVVAEESDQNHTGSLSWVIDPIDGTTNYITGYHHSCISIGLVEYGESVLGVVYNPYTDEMFYAARGVGAYMNEIGIRPSRRMKEQALVGFGTSPYNSELMDKTFQAAKEMLKSCADIRRSGSAALDLAYVACGRIDGFFEYTLSPWDYAAGVCIVREAGGLVSGIGEALSFDRPMGIMAASPAMWKTLSETVVRYQ